MTTSLLPAATIVVARPNPHQTGQGFQVLMTRRHPDLRFMGGLWVFPGGGLTPADYLPPVLSRCRGINMEQAKTVLKATAATGDDHLKIGLGFWVAAARELFEETGILLMVTANGIYPSLDYLEATRNDLIAGQTSFADLLMALNGYLPCSDFLYLGRLITPDTQPRRFDTRFFLTTLSVASEPRPFTEEVVDWQWVAPATVLEQKVPVAPPTYTVLHQLATFSDIQALQALLARDQVLFAPGTKIIRP